MNFVFLMDPLSTVIMHKDTSFILMLGAYKRGHKVYYLSADGISRKQNQLHFHLKDVIPQRVEEQPFIINDSVVVNESAIDAVFIRTDPPFNEQYLMHTWLLDLLPENFPIINHPNGVRSVNEKVWCTRFKDIIPPTFIGRHKAGLLEFILEHKNVVTKPTNGYGGQGIFHIQQTGTNTNVILETLTDHWQKDIILQKFIPESKDGDKRILLLDGEPLGAILRLHGEDDHRNNFFSGGKAIETKITDNDLKIINILKPKLEQLGLHFVGIDIMGDYLIEVNVTSPTCLQEMNTFYKTNLENKVIEFAEKLVDQYRNGDTIQP